MKRKIEKRLIDWKGRKDRRPLFLSGARQAGKTYAALNFGKKYFTNVVYFNFEGSMNINKIFERDLNPERIIRELSAFRGETILPNDTLIIFDEIQACERAVASLKYFCEEAPQYAIIAISSLMGFITDCDKFSFPMGKVDILKLYPLDFEEFLLALSKEELCVMIRECYANFSPLSLHDTAMDLYRLYLTVGGMPRAVMEYVERCDFDFVMDAQKTLSDAYIADMAKYADPQTTARSITVWNSLPAQLAKGNRKFQYSLIKPGARASQYDVAVSWLETAGVINKCVHVVEGKMPLSSYSEPDSFKIYVADTSILLSKFEIAPNLILNSQHNYYFRGFRGILLENYIMQALVSNGLRPYYWTSRGKAEVDFIFQDSQGNVVPLDAKYDSNVRSKSLKVFLEFYDVPYSIIVSSGNFSNENGIRRVPLYAVFCVK